MCWTRVQLELILRDFADPHNRDIAGTAGSGASEEELLVVSKEYGLLFSRLVATTVIFYLGSDAIVQLLHTATHPTQHVERVQEEERQCSVP
jgi:hypothetical protein